MSIAEIVTLIVSFSALIGTGFGVYAAWKKTPSENRVSDSTAAERYEGMVVRQADRIEALENKLIGYDDLKRDLVDFKDWAERLCHQVISLGGTPVKFRPSALDVPTTPTVHDKIK
jgi:hypothetical protein